MGYFIVGILSFIAGVIICYQIVKKRKEELQVDSKLLLEMIKKNANAELKKIKEKLSKGTKEKDRDEIIKGIDNYFILYGNPYDNGNGE